MAKEKVDVFYVEDNEDYIDFVKRALKKVNTNISYDYVTDGKEAFEYFLNRSVSGAPAKVILLDINLPGINGIDLLRKIRSMSSLKYTPVIIFSTSDNPIDVKNSYDNGANAYLVKPAGLNSLTETMKRMCDFWLSSNNCYN